MGWHRVRHDWNDLVVVVVGVRSCQMLENYSLLLCFNLKVSWGNTMNPQWQVYSFILHPSIIKSQEGLWVSHLGYVSKREPIAMTRALEYRFGGLMFPSWGYRVRKAPSEPMDWISHKKRIYYRSLGFFGGFQKTTRVQVAFCCYILCPFTFYPGTREQYFML